MVGFHPLNESLHLAHQIPKKERKKSAWVSENAHSLPPPGPRLAASAASPLLHELAETWRPAAKEPLAPPEVNEQLIEKPKWRLYCSPATVPGPAVHSLFSRTPQVRCLSGFQVKEPLASFQRQVESLKSVQVLACFLFSPQLSGSSKFDAQTHLP